MKRVVIPADPRIAQDVATLTAGQTVTATVHPYGRGRYQITGTLRDDAGVLRIGGWEAVRLADGTPPAYLVGVQLHDAVAEPAEPSWAVTEPTLLHDIPEHVYHSGGVQTPGPQVSQSGLKMLRPPSTPREFQHYVLNGLKPSRALDFGQAVIVIPVEPRCPIYVCILSIFVCEKIVTGHPSVRTKDLKSERHTEQ